MHQLNSDHIKHICVLSFSGGLEEFEDRLQAEEDEKEKEIQEENDRRVNISSKTRNRLTSLLDRKRAEAAPHQTRGGDAKEAV